MTSIWDLVGVLSLISDEQPVRFEARSFNMLPHATTAVSALVIAARMYVALDHLLTIFTPPAATEHKESQ